VRGLFKAGESTQTDALASNCATATTDIIFAESVTGTNNAHAVRERTSKLSRYATDRAAESVESGYVSDVSDDDDLYEAQFDSYDSVYASSYHNLCALDKQHSTMTVADTSKRLSLSTASLSSLDSSVHSSSSSGTTALSAGSVSPQC
jgi:hypothetical protein